jgi:hypothetical protein
MPASENPPPWPTCSTAAGARTGTGSPRSASGSAAACAPSLTDAIRPEALAIANGLTFWDGVLPVGHLS